MNRNSLQNFLVLIIFTFSAQALKALPDSTPAELKRCWNRLDTASATSRNYDFPVAPSKSKSGASPAKVLSFWNSNDENPARPWEPLGYVVLHKDRHQSFGSLTEEEKVSILTQLAMRNLNVGLNLENNTAVSGLLKGLFNQTEPYVSTEYRTVKVADIKSIDVNALVTLSLTSRYTLSLVKPSEAQVIGEFSEGHLKTRNILQDLFAAGADVDLLPYHLDHLGLRGIALEKAYANTTQNPQEFLNEVSLENLTPSQ